MVIPGLHHYRTQHQSETGMKGQVEDFRLVIVGFCIFPKHVNPLGHLEIQGQSPLDKYRTEFHFQCSGEANVMQPVKRIV
jgi:hypothetical protein